MKEIRRGGGSRRGGGNVKKGQKDESFRVLWEKFRRKAGVDEIARKKGMEALVLGTKGRLRELSGKHVESRVVQAMLKYANESQRLEMASELIGPLAELAKLPYARHVALAVIRYCGQSQAKEMYQVVAPQAIKLAVHTNGAKVLDSLILELSRTSGPEKEINKKYARKLEERLLFKDSLQDEEKAADGRQRLLLKMADKALVHLSICHDLLLGHTEMCLFSAREAISTRSESILPSIEKAVSGLRILASHFTEAALHCVASMNGALGLCDLTLCAEAKTRKKIAKVFKSRIQACADHKYAYLVLWRLLDVTDDTVTMTKALVPGILAVALAPTSCPLRASRLLSFFLNPTIKLDQAETRALSLRPEHLYVSDTLTASKKPSEIRYNEIAHALSPLLSQAVKTRPANILASASALPLLSAAAASGKLDDEACAALAAVASSSQFLITRQIRETKKERPDSNDTETQQPFLAHPPPPPTAATDHQDIDDSNDDLIFDEAAFEAKLDAIPDLTEEEEEEDEEHEEALLPEPDPNCAPRGQAILDHDLGHLALKTILQREAAAHLTKAPIASALYARIQGSLSEWIQTNRGALVIEAFLRYDRSHDFVSKLQTELQTITPNNANPGAAALFTKLEQSASIFGPTSSKKKKKQNFKPTPAPAATTGNTTSKKKRKSS